LNEGADVADENQSENSIVIYCDGACSGNPGPGGWGAIVSTPDLHVRELGGGLSSTTNNQMELTGAIEALKAVEGVPGEVLLHTDSVYVIRGITQWIWGWIRNGWRTAEGNDVLNKELWQALSQAVGKRKKPHHITWKYVRGHSGTHGNERCDEIAVAFSKRTPIHLYDGLTSSYRFDVRRLPPDQPLPEMRGKQGEKKAAHSYVSLLGGIAMRHATWSECERRVKGQPGAKFKKSQSADDEASILRSWGVDPKSIKS
jgi:ribonuclease HI